MDLLRAEAVGATLVTTTPLVVLNTQSQDANLTVGPISQPQANQVGMAQISGVVNVTPGAATTSVTLAVKFVPSGVVLGPTITVGVTAAVPISIPYDVVDLSNGLAGQTGVSLTVTQVAATGNGTVNIATMKVSAAN